MCRKLGVSLMSAVLISISLFAFPILSCPKLPKGAVCVDQLVIQEKGFYVVAYNFKGKGYFDIYLVNFEAGSLNLVKKAQFPLLPADGVLAFVENDEELFFQFAGLFAPEAYSVFAYNYKQKKFYEPESPYEE